MKKKTSYIVGGIAGVIVAGFLVCSIEAILLGTILSWFSVNLTFWQNFAIIFLANVILGGSRK